MRALTLHGVGKDTSGTAHHLCELSPDMFVCKHTLKTHSKSQVVTTKTGFSRVDGSFYLTFNFCKIIKAMSGIQSTTDCGTVIEYNSQSGFTEQVLNIWMSRTKQNKKEIN